MKRRSLLKAVSATAGAMAIPLAARADSSAGSKTAQTADVVVVGGGTAGTIAAIQAARAGAKTLLIDAMTSAFDNLSTNYSPRPSTVNSREFNTRLPR